MFAENKEMLAPNEARLAKDEQIFKTNRLGLSGNAALLASCEEKLANDGETFATNGEMFSRNPSSLPGTESSLRISPPAGIFVEEPGPRAQAGGRGAPQRR